MRVKVHYISLIKSIMHKSQDEISNDNATLAQLLNQIADICGK